MPSDHQPFLGSRSLTLEACLPATLAHLNAYRPFLPVAHRQLRPHRRVECFPPDGHRLPWGLRWSSTPAIRGQRDLQVPYRGGAGYAQHVALAALSQVVAKPRMTPQFIIADHPAMRHLRTPHVEHVQTLLGTRAIRHVLGHVACLASLLV